MSFEFVPYTLHITHYTLFPILACVQSRFGSIAEITTQTVPSLNCAAHWTLEIENTLHYIQYTIQGKLDS